ADAERERGQNGDRERRCLHVRPHRVANILHQVVEEHLVSPILSVGRWFDATPSPRITHRQRERLSPVPARRGASAARRGTRGTRRDSFFKRRLCVLCVFCVDRGGTVAPFL